MTEKIDITTIHSFAVCAYQESPWLEECLASLKKQTVKSEIFVATSTPSKYLEELSSKYEIPLYVRDGASDIQDDWNFAYDLAKTPLVTIAHQDDYYHPEYVKELVCAYEKYPDMTLFFTDYYPVRVTKVTEWDKYNRIKWLLRMGLRIKSFAHTRLIKLSCIALGNSICCPAVTYAKEKLGSSIFQSDMKYTLDWEMYWKVAKMPGRFVCKEEKLVYYRIHDEATSKTFSADGRRKKEELDMFCKMWPRWFSKLIMIFYARGAKSYE